MVVELLAGGRRGAGGPAIDWPLKAGQWTPRRGRQSVEASGWRRVKGWCPQSSRKADENIPDR